MYSRKNIFVYRLKVKARANTIIELIHSDICGPINSHMWNDINKIKKSITLIDDFNYFTVIFFLSNKNETFKVFTEYIAVIEAQYLMFMQ